MTARTASRIDPRVVEAITLTVRDYYEGWFDGDAARMRRALHPDLVKRGIADPTRAILSATAEEMVAATEQGAGTQYGPDRRNIDISINHVHVAIADVHVTGDVYVDYLQLIHVDDRWQIIHAVWAPADTAKLSEQ